MALPDTLMGLLATALGSAVVTALITGLFQRRKVRAEAAEIVASTWQALSKAQQEVIGNLDQRLNAERARRDVLEQKMQELQSQLGERSVRMAELQADNVRLRAENAELQAQVVAMDAKLDAVQVQVEELQRQLALVCEERNALLGRLEAARKGEVT